MNKYNNEYDYNFEEIENEKHIDVKSKKKRINIRTTVLFITILTISVSSMVSVCHHFKKRKGIITHKIFKEYTDANDKEIESIGLINNKERNQNAAMTIEEIVEKVLPSVVGIEAKFNFIDDNSNMNDFFGFSFGRNGVPRTQTAIGTGIIITNDGYIVTNAHVIYERNLGKSNEISVLLNNEKTYNAEIIGYDNECDLAVLKINIDGLTAAEFGNSSTIRLGESVVAIGNPLGFELMDTVTSGIISGVNRNITINDKKMTLIQTDASINSGNSGGPLINKYGQVIGINSSKMSSNYISSATASIEGIGFAIPSNSAAQIIDDLMNFGYVTGKPQLGISCQDVTKIISNMYNMPMGVYVVSVSEGSAAEKAGIKKGDIIINVDDEDIETFDELNTKKNAHNAGDKIKITFIRNGEKISVEVILDELKKKN